MLSRVEVIQAGVLVLMKMEISAEMRSEHYLVMMICRPSIQLAHDPDRPAN